MTRASSSLLLLAALLLVQQCAASREALQAKSETKGAVAALAKGFSPRSDQVSWITVKGNSCKNTCRAEGLVPVATMTKKMAGYPSWLCMYQSSEVDSDGTEYEMYNPGSTNAPPGTPAHGCYFASDTQDCPQKHSYLCACQQKRATKWVNVADIAEECAVNEAGLPMLGGYQLYSDMPDKFAPYCRVQLPGIDGATTWAYSGGYFGLDPNDESEKSKSCWYNQAENNDRTTCQDGMFREPYDGTFDVLCVEPL